MALIIGEINELVVKKETDISYTLVKGDEEVFLHFNQTPKKLKIGEVVNAFLYFDQKKRLCATLEVPTVTTTKWGYGEVVDVNENIGIFVNIGINKDILLSFDYLPKNPKFWPMIGTKVPCILKAKTNQLVAKIVSKEDRLPKTKDYSVNDQTEGIITKLTFDGATCFDECGNFIFIYKSLLRGNHYIGERINFTIININEHGFYNATTIERKENARLTDSDTILNYLRTRGGIASVGNKSSAEDIYRIFKLSKSAFKRATGHLYKERLIIIEDYKIILNEE